MQIESKHDTSGNKSGLHWSHKPSSKSSIKAMVPVLIALMLKTIGS